MANYTDESRIANNAEESAHARRRREAAARRKLAAGMGALVDAPAMQALITQKELQHALSTFANPHAHIINAGNVVAASQLGFRGGNHTSLNPANAAAVRGLAATQKARDVDRALLAQLFTAYIDARKKGTGNALIYMPAFCRGMGIGNKNGNPNVISKKLGVLEGCIAVCGSNIMKVFSHLQYDSEAEVLAFESPYFDWLVGQTVDGESRKPAYCWLVHSKIANERNKAAVDVVYRILPGLLQRGSLPDAELARNKNSNSGKPGGLVTFSISYRTLISECPVLHGQLSSIKHAKDKNIILKRVFSKVPELIHAKTDLHSYYIGLSIQCVIPTISTLDSKIVITHKGINKN